jgi:hypothetical protein
LLPLQDPDALHELAFVLLQDSVLLPLLFTEVGEATSDTVGAGEVDPTVTVTLSVAEPLDPVQVRT